MTKGKTKAAPSADDQVRAERRQHYDDLIQWMHDNGARLLWSMGGKDKPGGTLDAYQFGGRVVIVQTYARGDGWEFYAPIQTESTTWKATREALAKLLD